MAPTYSGIITVTTAGTAVQGPDSGAGTFIITFNPDETGYGYVGNVTGDVAVTNGLHMSPGDKIIVTVRNLKSLWFDTSVNGEIFSWLKIGSDNQPIDMPIETA